MATAFTTSFMKARFADGIGSAETTPAGYWGRAADSEVLASGGGKAGMTEAGRAGDETRSSQRPGDRALAEEISGGGKGQPQGEQPGRLRIRRKEAANRRKLQADEFDDEDDMDQDPPTSDNDVKVKLLYKEIENLRLQLALKTKDLEFELILKTKEIESLQKQNEELKTENENLKKTELQGGMPPRKRKVITKRTKPQVDGAEEQNDMARLLNGAKRFHLENENLKLQLALKTKELELEENRILKLELILKTKENESLLKQNEELKAENERLKRTAKPPRTRRLCRSCQSFEFHDSRNCPEKQQAARSSEEEDYE